MSRKKATAREGINDTSGAHLFFKSLPEPYNSDPYMVEKFETAKARLRNCKLPKVLEDSVKFRITSKEFILAPFKSSW
jgi:hypothetical protein